MHSQRPPVALSTMYWQHKGWSLRTFWERAQALGFAGIEISHVVREADVADLRPGDIPILAVHAPAPRREGPSGWDAMRLISAPDEEARRWAVAQVEHSIRWAAAMGARAVCVHLGTVEGLRGDVWALEQRYLAGQKGTAIYEQRLHAVREKRATLAPPYLEAARRSLEALARCAAREGVRLGLESRRYFFEIPTLEEAERLLADHDPDIVGFWYDSGHCQVLANLGFIPHAAWLERLGHRLVGAHLHDTRHLRDHLIPGLGEIAWTQVRDALPATAVWTLEVDWYFEPEEVQAGLDLLETAAL